MSANKRAVKKGKTSVTNHNITIYSTPTCPYCHMAKQYLTSKNISYKDIDVSGDDSAAKEMIQKSGQMGVPVIDIDGQIIVGFQRDAIEALVAA